MVLPPLTLALAAFMLVAESGSNLRVLLSGVEIYQVKNGTRIVGPIMVGITLFLMTAPLRFAIVTRTTLYQLTDRRLVARNRIFRALEWQIAANDVRLVEVLEHGKNRATLTFRTSGPLGRGGPNP